MVTPRPSPRRRRRCDVPDVDSQGVRIHYELAGQGRPLVLLHGATLEGSAWSRAGYVEALERDHRLLILDWRGHGQSAKPHDPKAYQGEVMARDILAVVDAEAIERFAIWGHSSGGWLAWVTALAAPERVAAMIATGSADPTPDTPETWAEFDEGFGEPVRRAGMRALVEATRRWERGPLPGWVEPMMLRADEDAFLASISSENLDDGIPSLDDFPVPVLLIVGEYEDEDAAAPRVAATVPRGESLVLPGLGHVGAFDRSDLVLPTARAFLDRWFPWG